MEHESNFSNNSFQKQNIDMQMIAYQLGGPRVRGPTRSCKAGARLKLTLVQG